jgi:ABC-2 type transport system permease protein
MTVVTEQPSGSTTATGGTARPGPTFGRLVRAELVKIRTTNLWWIFSLCAGAALALALMLNVSIAGFELDSAQNPPNFAEQFPPGAEAPTPEEVAEMEAQWRESNDLGKLLVRHAGNIFTSGQFFGLMILMLLGAMLVTGEYYNQTATTTFLGSPRRSRVILAKVATAAILATIAWGATTLINVGVGSAFFAAKGLSTGLGIWEVQRAIIMNLPAYALWALLGMGLGALLRNQIAATVTGAGLYFLGQIAQLVFVALYQWVLQEAWVIQSVVLLPAIASSIMISPEPVQLWFDENGPIYGPPWWVGGLVLLGYGVVATWLGTLLIRRRDIG